MDHQQPTTKENKHYKWNFTVNLIDGASFWFGNIFISTSTIIPLFISKLTTSLIPIGLVGVITSAGWFLPQLFAARFTEKSTNMKKFCVRWGLFLERIPIWMIVVSAVLAIRFPDIALILILLSLTWHTMGAGLIGPSWMAMLAKIFSPEKRGSFLGITMFVGVGFGILGSALSAWMLETMAFPISFIWHFSIAAFFITLSWVFLSLTKEPVGEVEIHDRDWNTYWRDLIRIIREDTNFRRFIISNIILTIGRMGYNFMTVSAIQRFQVSDSTVGLYTLVMLVGEAIGNLILGKMADRFGHKLSVEIGVVSLLLAFILAIVTPSPAVYFVIFALMGINLSSGIVSGMMVVWEFCDISRVPTYSGLANTTRGIFGLLSPMLATQLANLGYGWLFSICVIFILIGLSLMRFWVKEPRWHTHSIEEG